MVEDILDQRGYYWTMNFILPSSGKPGNNLEFEDQCRVATLQEIMKNNQIVDKGH